MERGRKALLNYRSAFGQKENRNEKPKVSYLSLNMHDSYSMNCPILVYHVIGSTRIDRSLYRRDVRQTRILNCIFYTMAGFRPNSEIIGNFRKIFYRELFRILPMHLNSKVVMVVGRPSSTISHKIKPVLLIKVL